MKRIDELSLLEDQFSKEQKKATLVMLIIQAIENVEKLIEGNPEFIESPMTYNLVGGIIDQLKANVPCIYKPAEWSFEEQMKMGDGVPAKALFGENKVFNTKPLYGENT